MRKEVKKNIVSLIDGQIKLSKKVNYYNRIQLSKTIDGLKIPIHKEFEEFKEILIAYNESLKDLHSKLLEVTNDYVGAKTLIYGLKLIKKQLK